MSTFSLTQLLNRVFDSARNALRTTGTLSFEPLAGPGRIDKVTLTDTTWKALPVLSGRSSIAIQNQSDNGGLIMLRYDDPAAVAPGWRVEDGGNRSLMVNETVNIYARMELGSGTALVDQI